MDLKINNGELCQKGKREKGNSEQNVNYKMKRILENKKKIKIKKKEKSC